MPPIIAATISRLLTKRSLIVISIVTITIIILGVLATTPRYSTPKAFSTAVDASSFAMVEDNNLYYFDGAGFVRYSLIDHKTTVLANSQRLPKVSNVWWAGDKGVYLQFSGSYDFTDLQSVVDPYDELTQSYQSSYIWYYDYQSRSFARVSDSPTVNNIASVSPKDHSLWYVINHTESDDLYDTSSAVSSSIYRFEPSTKKSEVVASTQPFMSITGIYSCQNTMCVAGSVANDTMSNWYRIDEKKFEKITSLKGTFIPTNNQRYIIQLVDTTADVATDHSDSGYEAGPYKVLLFDSERNTSKDLGFQIPDTSIAATIDDHQTVLLTNGDTGGIVAKNHTTSLLSTPITTSQPLAHTENRSLVRTRGLTKNGMLLEMSNGDNVYISPKDTVFPTPSTVAPTEYVDNCVTTHADSYNYNQSKKTFDIIVYGSDQYQQTITALSTCLHQDALKVFGYKFSIHIASNTSGRIISD